MGPSTLRTAVGMGISVRGVHAGREAEAWLLCAAAALLRPRDRVGERRRRERGAAARRPLRDRTRAARSRVQASARARALAPGRIARARAAPPRLARGNRQDDAGLQPEGLDRVAVVESDWERDAAAEGDSAVHREVD